jgi:hypothetical protein
MRQRLSWNLDKVAEQMKKADPYTMNQEHANNPVEKYHSGDPDAWAETPDMKTPWKNEGRDETGHPAPAHEAVKAARMLEDKALKCITIAQRMLPGAVDAAIEEQATDLMYLPERSIMATLQRQAELAETLSTCKDDDDDDDATAAKKDDEEDVEAKKKDDDDDDATASKKKDDEEEVEAKKKDKDEEMCPPEKKAKKDETTPPPEKKAKKKDDEEDVEAKKVKKDEEDVEAKKKDDEEDVEAKKVKKDDEEVEAKKKDDEEDVEAKKKDDEEDVEAKKKKDDEIDLDKEASVDFLDQFFAKEEVKTGAKKLSGIVKQASASGVTELSNLWDAPPDVSKNFK